MPWYEILDLNFKYYHWVNLLNEGHNFIICINSEMQLLFSVAQFNLKTKESITDGDLIAGDWWKICRSVLGRKIFNYPGKLSQDAAFFFVLHGRTGENNFLDRFAQKCAKTNLPTPLKKCRAFRAAGKISFLNFCLDSAA